MAMEITSSLMTAFVRVTVPAARALQIRLDEDVTHQCFVDIQITTTRHPFVIGCPPAVFIVTGHANCQSAYQASLELVWFQGSMF